MRTLLALALALAAALPAGAKEPFSYPRSLLQDRPVLAPPAASSIAFGGYEAVLETTPIREAATRLGAALVREGNGDFRRDWACLYSKSGKTPVTAWLIASDSNNVTEVQLERGVPSGTALKGCRKIGARHLPATIGGVAPGMSEGDVLRILDIPSHAADDGWLYWSTTKTVNTAEASRIQMNWTGVLVKKGRVERVFSSQVTNP